MTTTTYFFVGAIVLAFVLAAAAVRLSRSIVDRMLGSLDLVGADTQEGLRARAQPLIRALTLLAYGVAAVASVALALTRFGVDEPRWDPKTVSSWVLGHGTNILIILVGGWVVVRVASLAIEHLQLRLLRRHARTDLEWQRRATTLSGILSSIVTASVGFVAILMLLRELSVDVMPILTGAGIAGLAIGFGAQNLVRDVISGFFLILEDQVRVGDSARINGITGLVEQINLRTIVLRDDEGAVQVFPNGTVTTLANLSKQFAYAIVDLRVAYSENFDRVTGTIREVGAAMQRDSTWSSVVRAPIEVVGVTSLADGFATVRARFKTIPLNQGAVANELRRRLIGALVGRGIRPFAG